MMRKISSFVFAMIVMLSLVSATKTMAYDGAPMYFVTSADQYYSVMFDEEGEAVVSLRLYIRNTEAEPLKKLNIEIPGTSVNVLGVMQESTSYETSTCVEWSSGCEEYGQGQTCVQYDYNGNCLRYQAPCLRQGTVCTRYATSYNYDRMYQKIDVEPIVLSGSVSLPIELKSPIDKNGETNLIIVYKAEGYSRNLLGSFNFDFETVKLPIDTSSVRVGIDVQENLHLKGGKSNVNYRTEMNAFSKMAATSQMDVEMSRQIGNYANSISYAGGLVKTATYLDPFESFSVKGEYSSSWVRLYIGRIFLVLAIIAGVLGFLGYGARKLQTYAKENIKDKPAKTAENRHMFLIPFMAGLLSVIGIALMWALAIFVLIMADSMMDYSLRQVFGLLMMLIVILITLAVLIGVPIYTGTRYGATIGVFTVVSMLGWLFIMVILVFMVLNLIIRPVVYY